MKEEKKEERKEPIQSKDKEPTAERKSALLISSDEKRPSADEEIELLRGDTACTETSETPLVQSFKFSYEHFTDGIKKGYLKRINIEQFLFSAGKNGIGSVSENHIENISNTLTEFSKLFSDNLTVPKLEKGVFDVKKKGCLTVFKKEAELFENVVKIIKKRYGTGSGTDGRNTANNKILKVIGPIGSYKNRFLQYLYLYIVAEAKKQGKENFPVFYVDCSKYEISNDINNDKNKINEIISSAKKRNAKYVPLLILDNIRDFRTGRDGKLEEAFADIVSDCNLIASYNTLFTRNTSKVLNNLPFDEKHSRTNLSKSEFGTVISISPLNLFRKRASKNFIEHCLSFFKEEWKLDELKKVQASAGETLYDEKRKEDACWKIDPLRDKLIDLELFTIDAYQLGMILKSINKLLKDKEWNDISLPDIYADWIGEEALDKMEDIPKQAYDFEFSADLPNNATLQNKDWAKIRKHKSILDYLVAKHYVNQLVQSPSDISALGHIYNQSVNRFIVPIIKTNNNVFSIINSAIRDGKDQLSTDQFVNIPIIAQFVYIYGRFSGQNRETIINNLKGLSEKIIERLKKTNDETYKKKLAFLLRSVYISLMFQGDKDALNEYITLLFPEEILKATEQDKSEEDTEEIGEDTFKGIDFAGMNNGFHLEYYGDVSAGAPGECPECKDDLSKGINALRKICINIKRDAENFNGTDTQVGRLVLYAVSFCQLMDKRMEPGEAYVDKNMYAKYKKELEKVTAQVLECFDKCGTKLPQCVRKYLEEKFFEASDKNNCGDVIDKLFKLQDIPRAGWKKRDVEAPESVAEHSYNCWLIGYMFLPKEYKNEQYDRDNILTLLLIHDFGETEIGDVIEKNTEEKEKEKEAFKRVCRQVTKDWKKASELIALWEEMEKDDTKNINAKIAKEIDLIQRVYQYLIYFSNDKIKMLDEGGQIISNPMGSDKEKNLEKWREDISDSKITTEIGRQIRDKLIFHNKALCENKIIRSMIVKSLQSNEEHLTEKVSE